MTCNDEFDGITETNSDDKVLSGDNSDNRYYFMKYYPGTKGKKFTAIVESSTRFQATYVHFYWINNKDNLKSWKDDDSLTIPLWEDDDEKWDNFGIAIFRKRALIMSHDDFDKLSNCDEDDWYNWEDVLYENIRNEEDLDLQFS
uniref:Uncharacterized protein n=1 Tax=Pithovirus LCPAC404 TaxID=2506597 RepID=A0A481ZBZ2_9VIRU|nr:MAG: hypothetical protein LCPAC404_01380 [Pithovirus LCPAC404]